MTTEHTAGPGQAPGYPQSGGTADQHLAALWRRQLTILSVAWLIIFLGYLETFASIVYTWWRSETYAHGFVVFPIALYLAWMRRGELATLAPAPTLSAVSLVGVGTLLWIAGHAANAMVVEQLAVIFVLQALVPAVLGWSVTRVLLFPLGFLLFAWPVGEGLVPMLQDVTAWFVVKGLQLTAIPVMQEGRYIVIPYGSFEVAEACSGVRYLMAALMLGTLYAYLSYRRNLKRLAFAAVSLIVPIVANGIRAYGIVMIAYLTDMKWAVGVDHLIYGWLFFGVVMLLLFSLGQLWQDRPRDGGKEISVAHAREARTSPARGWQTAALALLVGAAGPIYAALTSPRLEPGAQARLELSLPAFWGKAAPDAIDWHPEFTGTDREWRLVSAPRYGPVYLFIAGYDRQGQHAEMINSQNRLYDETRWRRLSDGPMQWGQPLENENAIHETLLSGPRARMVIWHWYEVDGQRTASPAMAKAMESRVAIFGARHPSCAIALATLWHPGQQDVRERLASAASELYTSASPVCNYASN
jgi:exosortase A